MAVIDEDVVNRWTEFKVRSRTGTGLRKTADRACFYNALRVAMRDREQYRYAEGFAWAGIPIHHAWVVDLEGFAIDVTWQEPGRRYSGVVLDLKYVVANTCSDDYVGPAFPELDQIDAIFAVSRSDFTGPPFPKVDPGAPLGPRIPGPTATGRLVISSGLQSERQPGPQAGRFRR